MSEEEGTVNLVIIAAFFIELINAPVFLDVLILTCEILTPDWSNIFLLA